MCKSIVLFKVAKDNEKQKGRKTTRSVETPNVVFHLRGCGDRILLLLLAVSVVFPGE